ncbi:Phosphoribosylformylglycinamidine synthase, partial [Dissostichus eleginoides]
ALEMVVIYQHRPAAFGQGSAIRPYPGHASGAGGTRKNEVNPGHCVSFKDSGSK